MEVIYEDNHIIAVNKCPGEIVQGDKTGDEPLVETVRRYIKEKYAKPGNVFCGVVHRLDRPVGGVVLFAKTSKALTRLNEMLRRGEIRKTYWALTRCRPAQPEARLEGYITSVERNNKSYLSSVPKEGAKHSALSYRQIAQGDHASLLEINLETGRKHQIRVMLSSIGCPVRGDLKYGDRRSNPDGSISLLARRVELTHPVSRQPLVIEAPTPDERVWRELEAMAAGSAPSPAGSHDAPDPVGEQKA
ncbi:RluA family pseudouridine synthase [Paramuribaculum intestinale]|uniref:RluA family pseudouridine synthase n=1 Tax=Paramuribaculum intestinale TaxID=2094151 RepID=UPI0025B6AF94|nr:RluA family pseudouridine synthase [Paramuribaculum intestinale]